MSAHGYVNLGAIESAQRAAELAREHWIYPPARPARTALGSGIVTLPVGVDAHSDAVREATRLVSLAIMGPATYELSGAAS